MQRFARALPPGPNAREFTSEFVCARALISSLEDVSHSCSRPSVLVFPELPFPSAVAQEAAVRAERHRAHPAWPSGSVTGAPNRGDPSGLPAPAGGRSSHAAGTVAAAAAPSPASTTPRRVGRHPRGSREVRASGEVPGPRSSASITAVTAGGGQEPAASGGFFNSLRAGAAGFLVKDIEPEDLLHSVRVAARGDALLAPSIIRMLIGRYVAVPLGTDAGTALKELTDREREAVALVARGLPNDQIAARMAISPVTAKTHVNRAMAKLGARAQLVVLAYESGLVSPRT
ncbi:response regulator transcription factor [Actinomadura madurae]|uniref:response regulator transcription factor n=1 Tax=Actinomadura madurae TaxID=1993 RepID=UPI001FD1BDDC|nr:response regulator transcription factor [Actinomadura madurae]